MSHVRIAKTYKFKSARSIDKQTGEGYGQIIRNDVNSEFYLYPFILFSMLCVPGIKHFSTDTVHLGRLLDVC